MFSSQKQKRTDILGPVWTLSQPAANQTKTNNTRSSILLYFLTCLSLDFVWKSDSPSSTIDTTVSIPNKSPTHPAESLNRFSSLQFLKVQTTQYTVSHAAHCHCPHSSIMLGQRMPSTTSNNNVPIAQHLAFRTLALYTLNNSVQTHCPISQKLQITDKATMSVHHFSAPRQGANKSDTGSPCISNTHVRYSDPVRRSSSRVLTEIYVKMTKQHMLIRIRAAVLT